MVAFHIVMEGRKSEMFTVRAKGVNGEQLDEKKVIIGNLKDPIWIGKASEAKEFFTKEFETAFEAWRRFKAGMGLPNVSWIDGDPDLMDAILVFQEHWEAYFRDRAIISRLDALLNRR